MATTLRIDEALYREAKAAAARQGITVTRLIEDALRLRLRPTIPPRRPEDVELPTFAARKAFPYSPRALKSLMRRIENEYDQSQMTLPRRRRR